MKYYFFILVGICIVSCDKLTLVEEVSNTIHGRYKCVSAIFNQSIDINGDGLSNNDLLDEFNSLSNAFSITEDGGQIYPAKEPDLHSKIALKVPLQIVYHNLLKDSFEIKGTIAPYIYFKYIIDHDGKLHYSYEPDYSDVSNCILNQGAYKENEHYKNIKNAQILKITEGSIEISLELCYLDMNRNQFIEDTIYLNYNRYKIVDW